MKLMEHAVTFGVGYWIGSGAGTGALKAAEAVSMVDSGVGADIVGTGANLAGAGVTAMVGLVALAVAVDAISCLDRNKMKKIIAGALVGYMGTLVLAYNMVANEGEAGYNTKADRDIAPQICVTRDFQW
jgi:hypothetical protein